MIVKLLLGFGLFGQNKQFKDISVGSGTVFQHSIDQMIKRLIKKIISRLISNINSHNA